MPRVADDAAGDQDAVVWRLLQEFVRILVIAVDRPARAVAIRNEVVSRIDGIDAVGEYEPHHATFAKACMWSRRARWPDNSLMSRPTFWISFQSRCKSCHRPLVQRQCGAMRAQGLRGMELEVDAGRRARHDAVHQKAHRLDACRMHQPAFGRRPAPRFRKDGAHGAPDTPRVPCTWHQHPPANLLSPCRGQATQARC